MHSLGDVWHPGSGVPCFAGFGSLWGVPCFAGFGGFAAFGGSQSHFLPYLPYLNAFLRWRLASWLWGSLFRRIWGFRSLWGFTVSLSSLSSLSWILMHSLGDVWHPGSGVPCFAGSGGFAAFGGSQCHFLPCLPYLNAFLRWRLASWLWGSLFRRIWGFRSLWGLTVLTFFLIFPILNLNAFLRWRLASWLWGSLFRRIWGFRSLWGLTVSLSSLSSLSWILMHSLGDVWHPGSGVPCFAGFGGFAAFGGSQSHFLPYLPYLNAFLRWRLASWLWGSLFRRIWGFRSLWGLTVSLSSLSSLS